MMIKEIENKPSDLNASSCKYENVLKYIKLKNIVNHYLLGVYNLIFSGN
jgi:hypothetical protein